MISTTIQDFCGVSQGILLRSFCFLELDVADEAGGILQEDSAWLLRAVEGPSETVPDMRLGKLDLSVFETFSRRVIFGMGPALLYLDIHGHDNRAHSVNLNGYRAADLSLRNS
jgi:hypothetical protein